MDNVISAISLANLCLKFADANQKDAAMNIGSEQWKKVVEELEIRRYSLIKKYVLFKK